MVTLVGGVALFLVTGCTASSTGEAPDASVCEHGVPLYAGGGAHRLICRDEAVARGLTWLDLSEEWTPVVLAAEAEGEAPAYRDTYLALADERYDEAGADATVARRDGYLEIYGVVPSFEVVRARLGDEERHTCDEAIDDTYLAALDEDLVEESRSTARKRSKRARTLRKELERDAERRGLSDLDALAAIDARRSRRVAELRALEARLAAVLTIQRHLVCEGLLGASRVDGGYGSRSREAVELLQRRNARVPRGRVDADVRALLLAGSRERDFQAALRVLRERVIAATGLIEDGSAGPGPRPVLGRLLDPPSTTHVVGHDPLPDAADDLVAAATEVAAEALGWTGPDAVRDYLEDRERTAEVAVRLPPLPSYHSAAMTLEVEIDRGDVWYDPAPRARTLTRRPALVLYTREKDRRIALIRWPTTIGGWEDQKLAGGAVEPRWKESPVGPSEWRTMYVAPTWLPPASTPDAELVRALGDDEYELKRDAIGPSYRSAYGLVMLVHEGSGIRTHGSGNLTSLDAGHSHGCHRLLPLHALRLGGFLLPHRPHERIGETRTSYARIVRHHGRYPIDIETRGYRIDFVEPVPVDVLPGTIRSRRKTPPRP